MSEETFKRFRKKNRHNEKMEADWGKKLANVAFNIIMMIEIKKNTYSIQYTYGKLFFSIRYLYQMASTNSTHFSI